MRVNIRFMHRLITLMVSLGTVGISILLLTACSDNTDPTPPEEVTALTKAVATPYVLGNALWEFNPEKGTSERLFVSNLPLLLLDIDQTGPQNDEGTGTTVLPEYAVYVIGQALWVYDLSTRQNAQLFDFAATDDSALGQTICDLQKVITVDEEQLKDRLVVFKEEPAAYVKTSEDAECDSDADFSYSKIIIADSFTETITIGVEETKENEDGVEVTKVVPKEVPVLVGKKSDAEEALMYSGKPLVNLDTKEFGYLGLDRSTGTYKFFLTNPETLEKPELWSITREEFKVQPESGMVRVSKDKLFPTLNRPSPYQFVADALVVEHNWKMVKLNYEDLFDDDKNREREFSLDHPIFERTPESVYSKADTRYHDTSEMLAIKDQNQVYTVDTGSPDNTLTLIRTMDDSGLLSFHSGFFNDHLFAVKQYAGGSALTAIELSTGQEQTLRGLSPGSLESIQFLDGSLFVSAEAEDGLSWQAQIYTNALASEYPTPLADTMWSFVYDGRPSAQTDEPYLFYPAILKEGVIDYSEHVGPTIDNPLLFRYEKKDSCVKCGEGEYFGVIPSVVGAAYFGIYIFSDTYGYVTIKKSSVVDTAIETYYFNPSQPGEMQLMYEQASDL